MKYWPRWIGDWRAKTAHLSLEQQGVYVALLDQLYATESALPVEPDALYRLAGAQSASERKSVDAIIAQYFERTDEGYVNARALHEIDHARQISAKQRAKATNRWANERATEAPAKPKRASKGNGADLQGFAEFWQAYPRHVGRAKAEAAWRKLAPDLELIRVIHAAIAAQESTEQWIKDSGAFVPHPATWLNGRRWTDEVPQ